MFFIITSEINVYNIYITTILHFYYQTQKLTIRIWILNDVLFHNRCLLAIRQYNNDYHSPGTRDKTFIVLSSFHGKSIFCFSFKVMLHIFPILPYKYELLQNIATQHFLLGHGYVTWNEIKQLLVLLSFLGNSIIVIHSE